MNKAFEFSKGLTSIVTAPKPEPKKEVRTTVRNIKTEPKTGL